MSLDNPWKPTSTNNHGINCISQDAHFDIAYLFGKARIFYAKPNTTVATCEAGSAYPSAAPKITPSFWCGSCCLFFSFLCCVMCTIVCSSFFIFIHGVVSLFSMYDFDWPSGYFLLSFWSEQLFQKTDKLKSGSIFRYNFFKLINYGSLSTVQTIALQSIKICSDHWYTVQRLFSTFTKLQHTE